MKSITMQIKTNMQQSSQKEEVFHLLAHADLVPPYTPKGVNELYILSLSLQISHL